MRNTSEPAPHKGIGATKSLYLMYLGKVMLAGSSWGSECSMHSFTAGRVHAVNIAI